AARSRLGVARYPDLDPRTAPRRGVDLAPTSGHLCPLSQRREPEVARDDAFGILLSESRTVVADEHGESLILLLEDDFHRGGSCMLARVRERFLCDPVEHDANVWIGFLDQAAVDPAAKAGLLGQVLKVQTQRDTESVLIQGSGPKFEQEVAHPGDRSLHAAAQAAEEIEVLGAGQPAPKGYQPQADGGHGL